MISNVSLTPYQTEALSHFYDRMATSLDDVQRRTQIWYIWQYLIYLNFLCIAELHIQRSSRVNVPPKTSLTTL